MIKHFKTAFVYIGSIIVAGFASGRELIIFFYDKGFLGLVLAAMLLGIMCGIFIVAIKVKVKNKFFDYIIFIGMCLTFILMVSATETLIYECFSIKYIGIISGIIVAILSCFNINWIKNINFIVIPLVVLMLIVLSSKADRINYDGISILRIFKYVGMNTLLGAIILGKDEESYALKDITITCVIVTVCFIALFYCTYKIACHYPEAALPIYAFAENSNFAYISAIIIYLAIFTTQLSSGYLICSYCEGMISYKYIAPVFLCALTICSFRIDYKVYSGITYPILGYMGLVYIGYILIFLSIKRVFQFNNSVYCFDRKIHNRSHKT